MTMPHYDYGAERCVKNVVIRLDNELKTVELSFKAGHI